MAENIQRLISVIVPVFNTEKYLDACIQSLVSQSHRNLEIILVDDGSTDKSGQICEAWAAQDGRIQVVHQSNRGLSCARNRGVVQSGGSYISFVDSDDWLDPDFYRVLLAQLLDNNADMAASCVKRVYQNGEQLYPYSDQKVYTPDEAMETVITGTGFTVMACNKLYKRKLVTSNPFPEGHIHEDDYVMYKIIADCERLTFCRDVFYHYRQRRHGTIGSGLSCRFEDKYDSYFRNADFVQMHFPQLLWMMKRLLCQYTTNDYTELFMRNDSNSLEMKKRLRNWRKSVRFTADELNRMSRQDRKLINRSRWLYGYCGYLAVLRKFGGNCFKLFE